MSSLQFCNSTINSQMLESLQNKKAKNESIYFWRGLAFLVSGIFDVILRATR